MSHPALPDPAAVARGAEIIEHELKRSLIMPRPADCIRSILRMLDAAYELLRQPTDDRNPYAVAAGIAVSLVDGYQRRWTSWGRRDRPLRDVPLPSSVDGASSPAYGSGRWSVRRTRPLGVLQLRPEPQATPNRLPVLGRPRLPYEI